MWVVPPAPKAITTDELLARYELFLLDAYGVLVSGSGALPGAAALLESIGRARKEYLVVSNDASRSVATCSARYRSLGLDIAPARVLTSGLLLTRYYAEAGLAGARTIVLGTGDSSQYVRDAGGVVAPADDDGAQVVVVCDDDGFPFLETVNDVVTVLLRRLARGEKTTLVLPNPDLIFPRGAESFGVTAGGIAVMIEAILKLRDATAQHRFVPLGKPHLPLFEEAARRFAKIDRRKMVMLGDQLSTDILGANRFGIDSVLLETGVNRLADLAAGHAQPTFILQSLA
jgi:HAD superfamily hydrolase (TIGR01450 family)